MQFLIKITVLQGSILGVHHVHTYAYFYKRRYDFFPMIFQSFQNVLVLIMYCLKTYCNKFDLSFFFFVLVRDRFFTVYICFKEALFFSSPQSNCQFRVSVRKWAIIVIYMYVIFIILLQNYEKTVHVHNYMFFWKGMF